MNNIILIGFMGTGKTSVGETLSNSLKMAFADTDQLIEKKEKKTISKIFEVSGEDEFRKMETELLKEMVINTKNTVISVGGGLPIREENRRLLKELGIVVFLKTDAQTIIERLKDDNTRPLLQSGNVFEKVNRMLMERNPIYKDACSFSVETSQKNVIEITEEIEERIHENACD
ncbi:MAG: shikimate kinase [Lachnospiraceae bacterium]|nr:shikimate kinase [Lachnospiraceae bacterium]